MRFSLIDRIIDLEPGKSITAIKTVSLAEEYLADHFPGFPVLPGVLMLEAMVQSGAWLIRASEDFAHSMILLKEARTVKYADFAEPGQQLIISVRITSQDQNQTQFQGSGSVNAHPIASARFTLERQNLREFDPELERADRLMIERLRELFSTLWVPPVAVAGQPAISDR